jgi:hypothetical protein
VCADATSLVERFMSTTKLHERIYAPYAPLEQETWVTFEQIDRVARIRPREAAIRVLG